MIDAALARIGVVSTRGRSLAYGTLSLAVLLIAWLLSTSVFQWIEPCVLPSPMEVVHKYIWHVVELFSGLTLSGHILASLER